jgi:N-acetylmuramoyl-L-alanine amidase
MLTARGATVYMTRCRDVAVSLHARGQLANTVNADLLVAIHLNARRDPAYDATGIYYLSARDAVPAGYMAGSFDVPGLWRGLNARLPLVNLRAQRRQFTVLLFSRRPSIFTEAVYMSNPAEAAALAHGNRVEQIARGHLTGILGYFSCACVRRQVRPSG